MKEPRMTPAVTRMLDLFEDGLSLRQIAAIVGVSGSTVCYHCVENGLKKSPALKRGRSVTSNGRVPFSEDEDSRIQQMRLEGKRISHIARELGRVPRTIRYRLAVLAIADEAGGLQPPAA